MPRCRGLRLGPKLWNECAWLSGRVTPTLQPGDGDFGDRLAPFLWTRAIPHFGVVRPSSIVDGNTSPRTYSRWLSIWQVATQPRGPGPDHGEDLLEPSSGTGAASSSECSPRPCTPSNGAVSSGDYPVDRGAYIRLQFRHAAPIRARCSAT